MAVAVGGADLDFLHLRGHHHQLRRRVLHLHLFHDSGAVRRHERAVQMVDQHFVHAWRSQTNSPTRVSTQRTSPQTERRFRRRGGCRTGTIRAERSAGQICQLFDGSDVLAHSAFNLLSAVLEQVGNTATHCSVDVTHHTTQAPTDPVSPRAHNSNARGGSSTYFIIVARVCWRHEESQQTGTRKRKVRTTNIEPQHCPPRL
jgi:hypothetical protein